MKAFLVYGYSQRNAGDMAITLGAIDLLKSAGYKIIIMSRYAKDDDEFKASKEYLTKIYHDELEILPCIFKLNRNDTLLKLVFNHFQGLLFLLGLKRAKTIEYAINKSNIVIFNGGNLLRCNGVTDTLRILALRYPLVIAKKLRKKIIILPQSCAKSNMIGKFIIRNMIDNAAITFVRESISYNALNDISSSANLCHSYDLAFFIKDDLKNKCRRDSVENKIAITLRGWTIGDITEFNDSKKKLIEDYFIRLCQVIPNKYSYLFVSQGKKDNNFTKIIAQIVKSKTSKNIGYCEELDPLALRRIYSSCSFLIGMRLHSIILALSCGIPAFGVFFEEWGNKNPGIMKDVGLDYTFIDMPNDNFPNADIICKDKQKFQRELFSKIRKEEEKLMQCITRV